MDIWVKRIGLVVSILVIVAAFYFAMREKPILVDVAIIKQEPMSVTIDEEGETRVRDVYTVSSPIAGHLSRTTLEEGETVVAHDTIIASIHPLDPPFLDERTRAEYFAFAEAARSGVAVSEVELTRATMAYELSLSEYRRALRLAKTNVISQSHLEKVENEMKLLKAQVDSAKAVIRLRNAELVSAEARLKQPSDVNRDPDSKDCCVNITSPESGVVLKILARSEQAVSSGTRIAEIGDPKNLEIVVDLLSSDAPKIAIGSDVEISEWGGESKLEAVVRRIDPAGFTKVSSLGIEEQRVNAVLDLKSVPDALGHGYRVLAKLVIWSQNDVLQVPIGALFRSNGAWTVFAIENGYASLRQISVGQMNNHRAQVLDGLTDGDQVVLYPNDLLEDGSLVEER